MKCSRAGSFTKREGGPQLASDPSRASPPQKAVCLHAAVTHMKWALDPRTRRTQLNVNHSKVLKKNYISTKQRLSHILIIFLRLQTEKVWRFSRAAKDKLLMCYRTKRQKD